MKNPLTSFAHVTVSLASLLAFAVPQKARCQTESRANAQALVEEAKKGELERKMAAKQVLTDRLSEDLKKATQEIGEVEKSIGKVGAATAEATGELGRLDTQKKRLTRDLELVELRISAEKLKAEGLKLLGAAHAKSRDALTKRTEELGLRTAVVAAEVRVLSGKPSAEPEPSGAKGSRPKSGPTLTELRKQLSKAEDAALTASSNARAAMEAASQKVQQAEAAAAKAEKKRAESAQENNPGFPGGNDPLKPTKR